GGWPKNCWAEGCCTTLLIATSSHYQQPREVFMHFSATTRKRGAAIFGALTLTTGLAACAEGGSQDNPAENTEFKVVASTPVWGDIAKAVIESVDGAEKTFSVETIMENKDDDPHGYEATAADIAKAKSAD